MTTVEPVFVAIKIAGAGYLLYLGIRSIIAARTMSAESLLADAGAGRHTSWRGIRQDLTVGVSNPKSIASLVAILPQFVDPSLGSVTVQMIIIGLCGGAAQVLIETLWVLTGSGLCNWFRRPGRVKIMKASGGIAMIGLSVRVAVERSAT